jgi:hypothetical protein
MDILSQLFPGTASQPSSLTVVDFASDASQSTHNNSQKPQQAADHLQSQQSPPAVSATQTFAQMSGVTLADVLRASSSTPTTNTSFAALQQQASQAHISSSQFATPGSSTPAPTATQDQPSSAGLSALLTSIPSASANTPTNVGGAPAPASPIKNEPVSEYDQLRAAVTEKIDDSARWNRLVDYAEATHDPAKVKETYEWLLQVFPNTVCRSTIAPIYPLFHCAQCADRDPQSSFAS